MRIIAGGLKGRRLAAPTWEGLRPTSDRLRETLFNVLAPRVSGARVLDGFAGTGALGIEALSRGAAQVTFIERDPRAVALVNKNLAACGVDRGCAIIRADFARGVASLTAHQAFVPFDIILLDPPYHEDSPDARLDGLVATAGDAMAGSGVIVLEHARRRPSPESVDGLTRVRQVASGDSMLSLYERTSRPT